MHLLSSPHAWLMSECCARVQVGKEIGLVDGVGEMRTELIKRFGRHVRLDMVEEEPGLDWMTGRLLRWFL